MLRGQDILVLVRLFDVGPSGTLQGIADSVDLDVASVHRSVRRLEEVQLVLPDRRVALPQADEFLFHGLRYVFPARFKGESRGIETAWAAVPLRNALTSSDAPPPVWAHPKGRVRGIALEPLHPSVPEAALRDPVLHERLALVDALRLGDARLRREARKALFPSTRAA
jgi:hypothetical protein